MTRRVPYVRTRFLADPDPWRLRAACRDDPERMFPASAEDQHQAVRICRRCPVRAECLGDALDNGIRDGVWGGMTERERVFLLTRHPDVTGWRERLVAERDARGGAA